MDGAIESLFQWNETTPEEVLLTRSRSLCSLNMRRIVTYPIGCDADPASTAKYLKSSSSKPGLSLSCSTGIWVSAEQPQSFLG